MTRHKVWVRRERARFLIIATFARMYRKYPEALVGADLWKVMSRDEIDTMHNAQYLYAQCYQKAKQAGIAEPFLG